MHDFSPFVTARTGKRVGVKERAEAVAGLSEHGGQNVSGSKLTACGLFVNQQHMLSSTRTVIGVWVLPQFCPEKEGKFVSASLEPLHPEKPSERVQQESKNVT